MSRAIVVAVGLADDERRELLYFDEHENKDFRNVFFRPLNTRDLDGIKLLMSEGQTGLKKAIGTVFQGTGWQRWRVDLMRNVLAVFPKGSQDLVASIIRIIFAQSDREHTEEQLVEVTTMLDCADPKVAAILVNAHPDLLVFAAFPRRHWRQIWSTNPLERVNKKIKRRLLKARDREFKAQ